MRLRRVWRVIGFVLRYLCKFRGLYELYLVQDGYEDFRDVVLGKSCGRWWMISGKLVVKVTMSMDRVLISILFGLQHNNMF